VILQRLCTEKGLQLHTLDMSELAKADGALTCCSVLVAAR
jgi:dimethylargininase